MLELGELLDLACWSWTSYVGYGMLETAKTRGHGMLELTRLCWTWHVGTTQTMLAVACWNRTWHVGTGRTMLDVACRNWPNCIRLCMLEPNKLCWPLHVGTGQIMLDIWHDGARQYVVGMAVLNQKKYVGRCMLELVKLSWSIHVGTC